MPVPPNELVAIASLAREQGVSEDAVKRFSTPCAAAAEPWRNSAMPTLGECRNGLPA